MYNSLVFSNLTELYNHHPKENPVLISCHCVSPLHGPAPTICSISMTLPMDSFFPKPSCVSSSQGREGVFVVARFYR